MEKLFFNKGLISGLILLGPVWTLNLVIALVKGSGSALENFAAIVNPENKPTKVNWTLSWPSALEIRGKTVLYSGFNKRSDSFGNSRQARFFAEQMSSFFLFQPCFFKKHGFPRFLATIANLPNIAWVQNNLEKLAQ